MSIKFDIDDKIKNFRAPSFLNFIIFFIVLVVVGYFVGLSFFLRDKDKGMKIYIDDPNCVREIKEKCKKKAIRNPNINFEQCVENLKKSCDKQESRSTTLTIILYIFLPLIIALFITSMLYKLVLYIYNPKLAAGVVIWTTLFPRKR